ncbi:MAG: mechanosensitive ion channel family protein [Anaerolineae bacterium]|jgi:small-conductance mechanosensitive channel
MRRKPVVPLAFALSLILLTVLSSACGSETATPIPTPTTVPTATEDAASAATVDPDQSATAEPEATGGPVDTGEKLSAGEVAAAVGSRTPVPTPTPDAIADKVEEVTTAAGLTGKTFLGLSAEDWVDIIISVGISFLGYLLALLAVKLFSAVVRRVVGHTSSAFDDAFVEAVGQEIQWLVMVLVLRYALLRLDFWSDGLRTTIDDFFFLLGLLVIVAGTLKLIQFVGQWYRDHLDPDKDKTRLEPVTLLLQRSAYGLVLVIAVSIGLNHFGIQITILAGILVLGALVIGLGARDVIADAISGLIILMDQPFRVGDIVATEELGTWGEVIDIGTRTTRILTRDKRMAIVPNSRIGARQVINYTFPEPNYRVYSEILVAYGSDFDRVRRVVHDAVRGIDGILPDQPVDVLFLEYGVSARVMRVRWWINDMYRERPIIARVNEALEIAFEKAGIEMPVTTRNLIVKVDPETAEQLSRSHGEPHTPGMPPAGSSMPGGEETE